MSRKPGAALRRFMASATPPQSTELRTNARRAPAPVFRRPVGSFPLPDTARHVAGFTIKSDSSTRLYKVSFDLSQRAWVCSCPGAISHGQCKHLSRNGLLGRGHGPQERPQVEPDMANCQGCSRVLAGRQQKWCESCRPAREGGPFDMNAAPYGHDEPKQHKAAAPGARRPGKRGFALDDDIV